MYYEYTFSQSVAKLWNWFFLIRSLYIFLNEISIPRYTIEVKSTVLSICLSHFTTRLLEHVDSQSILSSTHFGMGKQNPINITSLFTECELFWLLLLTNHPEMAFQLLWLKIKDCSVRPYLPDHTYYVKTVTFVICYKLLLLS